MRYSNTTDDEEHEMDRDDILAEDIAHDLDDDRLAIEAEARMVRAEAFEALVREDYEPSPYDGTYSEM